MTQTSEHRTQPSSPEKFMKGVWSAILIALEPLLLPAIANRGKHVQCPIHPEDNCFVVHDDVDRYGGCSCDKLGHFNGFSLLMLLHDQPYADVASDVGDYMESIRELELEMGV
jgi:putative DNA primase/helicase